MIVTQLSVFLRNKPGVLAEMCGELAKENINIRAISVSDTVDHAVVRLIVDEPDKALHLLGEHGVLVVETELLAMQLPDGPGVLADAARKLCDAGVNIEYAYGSGGAGECSLMIRVSDNDKAQAALA